MRAQALRIVPALAQLHLQGLGPVEASLEPLDAPVEHPQGATAITNAQPATDVNRCSRGVLRHRW